MKKFSMMGVAASLIGLIVLSAALSACTSKPTLSELKKKPEKELFSGEEGENGFIRAGGSKEGPTFELEKASLITQVRTLHTYDPFIKKVPSPGKISLKGGNGKTYGPWQAKGISLGNGPIRVWLSKPNVVLEPGRYTVVDSDLSSWSPEPEPSKTGIAFVSGKQ